MISRKGRYRGGWHCRSRTDSFQRATVHFFATCSFKFGWLRIIFQKHFFFERFSHGFGPFAPPDRFGRGFAPKGAAAKIRSRRMKTGFLIDMDGVLYRENHLIPGAADFVQALTATGTPFLFLTNNSAPTPED